MKPAESNNSALVMVSCAATKVPHIAPAIESPRRPVTWTICAIRKASSILVGLSERMSGLVRPPPPAVVPSVGLHAFLPPPRQSARLWHQHRDASTILLVARTEL